MVYSLISIIFVLHIYIYIYIFCRFLIIFRIFLVLFCLKLRNDFNLLFVACHNNRSFLTKKKIDEHGISAKKQKQQEKKSGVNILLWKPQCI